jgi:hypothetical protein
MIKMYEYLPWTVGLIAVVVAWLYDSRKRRNSDGDTD